MFLNSGGEPHYNDKGWELALYVIAAVHPHKLGNTSFPIYNVLFQFPQGDQSFILLIKTESIVVLLQPKHYLHLCTL